MMLNVSPKKLRIIRFLLNPKTPNPNSLISSPASTITPSINTPSNYQFSSRRFYSVDYEDNRLISNQNIGFMSTHALVTGKRPSDTRNPPYVSPKLVSQVIDVVRSCNGECRAELDLMDIRLSKVSICEILRVLSCEKVPALQFFECVRDNDPGLYHNADLCSLLIDNCGWLNDYDTMRVLLTRFKDENICLNDKAFGFLPVLDSSNARAVESVSLVVRVLDEIGGSVRSSGVRALFSMLCAIDSFELAKYVMEITEKKPIYYAILIRDKCRRGYTDEAYALINQMRVEDCVPDCNVYNYVLGSLCKMDKLSEALGVLEEMKQAGVDPDEITYEIFILHACRLGRMEFANERFDTLIRTGLHPRLSTYAAIVKGYFNAGRYEEAYAFVCDMEAKKMPAIHKMFSLLAWLHRKKGNLDAARRILDEMVAKGLKPDFMYYAKTINVLRRAGGKDLTRDLEKKVSELRVE